MVAPVHKFWHRPFVFLHHLIKGPAVSGLGISLTLIGIIFINLGQMFWILAIGVPAIIGGISFTIYGIYDVVSGLISTSHQITDCPLCSAKTKM